MMIPNRCPTCGETPEMVEELTDIALALSLALFEAHMQIDELDAKLAVFEQRGSTAKKRRDEMAEVISEMLERYWELQIMGGTN